MTPFYPIKSKDKEPKLNIKVCPVCEGTEEVKDVHTGKIRPCVINHVKHGMVKC